MRLTRTKWPNATREQTHLLARDQPSQPRNGADLGSEKAYMDQSERGEHDRNKLRGAIAALRVTALIESAASVPAMRQVATHRLYCLGNSVPPDSGTAGAP